MNCPKCNADLSWKKTKCDSCGQDLKIYRRILAVSNLYYNDGLTKAKVRDLSGAVAALKKSLKLNKKNTNARNLLGLVYYEMGEIVAALSEWVLSKHFQPENNKADSYMNIVQSNPSRLELFNQAIKKYNSALISAKQNNEDLAIIQLKKVVSLTPQFIRANHLLALLYIKMGEKEKALKVLRKITEIDVSNIRTLRYLREVEDPQMKKEIAATGSSNTIRKDETPSYKSISNYKEDKPNVFAFINIILGIVIGLGVSFFLIMPQVEKKNTNSSKSIEVDYSEKLADKDSKISSISNKNKKLEDQIKELKAQVEELKVEETDQEKFDGLFQGVKLYLDQDKRGAAEALIQVKESDLEGTYAKVLYQKIKDETFESVSEELFVEGRDAYGKQKYQEAIEVLGKAIALSPDNVDALYFLGRTYHQLSDKEKASDYYSQVINDFPDTVRASEARGKLNELN